MRTATATLLLLLTSSAFAGDLHVSVQSGGQNTVKVGAGAVVNYSVIGELSDNLNQGLGMFAFDLSFTGGALSQASAPSSGPMLNFAAPLGLNNPAGFGGTVAGGVLRQVGGAQNTINNVFAPVPSGSVITGIGAQGSPVVLASGSLTAPANPGVYTLSLSGLFANTIRASATGVPFWEVDAAGAGTITNLTVEVKSLTADVDTISISSPGRHTLSLNAGAANAGRVYWLLGSITGTTPGIPLFFTTLPLNYDAYMQYTINFPNTSVLTNFLGNLDVQGKATASLNLPSGLSSSLSGVVLNHAFVLFFPIDFASNPVSVTLVP